MNINTLFQIHYIPFVILLIMASCAEKSDKKKEELLIKDLERATNLIAEKNNSQYQRLKNFYVKDSTDKEIKGLYQELSRIKSLKEDYKNNLKNPDADFATLSKKFSEGTLALITSEERKSIIKLFNDSPILNTDNIQLIEPEATIPYELSLEAEIITQEMYKLVLRDYSKSHKGFDWEVFW